jgi:hypothetical protein
MGLAKGSEYAGASANQSAVGIKADHVRIMARNHIKIVTGKMKQSGGGDGEKLSNGGSMQYPGKIDFIAGNYTDSESVSAMSLFGSLLDGDFNPRIKKLQPLVKGENLIAFIEELLEIIEELKGMVNANNRNIISLTNAVSLHVHETNVPFGPTSPPALLAASLIPVQTSAFKNISDSAIHSWSMATLKLNYLESSFPKYINSRFVNTT